jgi:MFS family permease
LRRPVAFALLSERRFAWYFWGRLISTVGSTMAPVALTFAVLDLTGSASALGAALAARTIPMVVFLLIGGVVADRLSRSTVMQLSHLLSAATQGLVAALLLTGIAELWMVIVLEALNGVVTAFTFPAMMGVVPQVVERDQIQQANALLSFSRNGTAVIGPTIGALFVVTVGSGWAVAIDALTWLVAAFCMARLRLPSAARSMDEARPSMIREMKEGWGAFVSMTWIWVIVLAFGLLNAIQVGGVYVLGPLIAKDTIGEAQWGWVLSAQAAGFLAMTVLMMRWQVSRPLVAGMLGMLTVSPVMLALGLHPQVVLLMALMFAAGAGEEVFGIGWQTALHEHVPNEVLSRVSSYDALGSWVAIPIGQLAFGPLANTFDPQDVLVVSSVVYAAIALSTLLSRSVRGVGRVGSGTDAPAAADTLAE